MKIEFARVTWYSKLGALVLFVGIIPLIAFVLGMQYQSTLQTLTIADKAETEIYPAHTAYPGCVWKKLSSSEISLNYQQCDTGFNYIGSKVQDNKVVLTNVSKEGEVINTAAEIWLFKKNPQETPAEVLKRTFIDNLGTVYQREHCIVQKTNAISFMEPGKEAWIIEPDSTYTQKIAMTGELNIPYRVCGNFGKHVYNASYFEFHSDNNTSFIWVSAGASDPLFDRQSIDF